MTNMRGDNKIKVKTETNICSVSQPFNLLLLSLLRLGDHSQCVCTDPRVLLTEAQTS